MKAAISSRCSPGSSSPTLLPRFADALKEAVRPELYIKIAIVILGGFFAVTAAGKLNLACSSLLLRGVAAIIEAYLIYWAVVYFVARKWFGFSREWAAPLASGISICGVSAAIATGGAIRARPLVPMMVSSLVVVFAVVEVLILPFLAQTFLWHEPLVAGAWMGLAVKTDGAAVAGGGITESLILAQSGGRRHQLSAGLDPRHHRDGEGVHRHLHRHLGLRPRLHLDQPHQPHGRTRREPSEIWQRFPKFILGFVVDVRRRPLPRARRRPRTSPPRCPPRWARPTRSASIFFILTFFSIGVLSNFSKLWQEGIGKLAAVYVVSLFGFVIWVGLLISWLFFSGVKPPLAS